MSLSLDHRELLRDVEGDYEAQDVSIVAHGQRMSGWKSVAIAGSIEQIASTFNLSVSSRDPRNLEPIQIRPMAACQVWAGKDVLIDGYADDVSIDYDRNTHTIGVVGRSKVQDLVDCTATAEPGQWRNLPLDEFARRLAAPLGIAVVSRSDTGGPFDKLVVQLGETVHQALERYARLRGVLLTDDEQGRLVLMRADAGTEANGVLRYGENILRGSTRFSGSKRFSEYTCVGQQPGSNTTFGAAASESAGKATDDEVLRYRPLVVFAETGASTARCQDRAKWEAATRAGQASSGIYVVQGWRRPGRKLWRKGELVHVDDKPGGLSGLHLITDVGYVQSREQGTLCTITVAPPGGYEFLEPRKVTSKGSSRWKELDEVKLP